MITIALASRYQDDLIIISALLAEQKDFQIISIGKDSYDALKSAMAQKPDILIMDFIMEGIESSDLAPIIKRQSPSTALIVLCSHNEPFLMNGESTMAKALNSGISGYLLRREGFSNLASSIRSVFYGGLYVSEPVKDHIFNYLSAPTAIYSIETLSARALLRKRCSCGQAFTHTEIGILYGIIRGHSDREIAKDLNMSIGSLRNCVNKVKRKTGMQNRTRITIYAILAGIMSISKIKDAFL